MEFVSIFGIEKIHEFLHMYKSEFSNEIFFFNEFLPQHKQLSFKNFDISVDSFNNGAF